MHASFDIGTGGSVSDEERRRRALEAIASQQAQRTSEAISPRAQLAAQAAPAAAAHRAGERVAPAAAAAAEARVAQRTGEAQQATQYRAPSLTAAQMAEIQRGIAETAARNAQQKALSQRLQARKDRPIHEDLGDALTTASTVLPVGRVASVLKGAAGGLVGAIRSKLAPTAVQNAVKWGQRGADDVGRAANDARIAAIRQAQQAAARETSTRAALSGQGRLRQEAVNLARQGMDDAGAAAAAKVPALPGALVKGVPIGTGAALAGAALRPTGEASTPIGGEYTSETTGRTGLIGPSVIDSYLAEKRAREGATTAPTTTPVSTPTGPAATQPADGPVTSQPITSAPTIGRTGTGSAPGQTPAQGEAPIAPPAVEQTPDYNTGLVPEQETETGSVSPIIDDVQTGTPVGPGANAGQGNAGQGGAGGGFGSSPIDQVTQQLASDLSSLRTEAQNSTAPDAMAVFLSQGQGLIDLIDKQMQDLRSNAEREGREVDPATANLLDTMRKNLDEQLSSAKEDLNRRGLYDSGILLDIETKLRSGSASDQARILAERLSGIQKNLNDQIGRLTGQKIAYAGDFGMAGARAQVEGEENARKRKQDLMERIARTGLDLRGQLSDERDSALDRAEDQRQFNEEFGYNKAKFNIEQTYKQQEDERRRQAERAILERELEAGKYGDRATPKPIIPTSPERTRAAAGDIVTYYPNRESAVNAIQSNEAQLRADGVDVDALYKLAQTLPAAADSAANRSGQ